MTPIDLRSDTVTQPTEAMREAMARAEVGDDVLDEDPTVHRLQSLAAGMLAKPAALFVPSGTMANLIGVLAHCGRGDEVLLGDRSHIFINEVGGIAAFGGVHPHTVPNEEDGTLPLDALERAIRQPDLHFPPTRLICIENTHNYCGGAPLSMAYMASLAALARSHGLAVHLDGARLFNAAVALGVSAADLAREVDSVMISLSKGLSAPVGSVLAGSPAFVQKARKLRKMAGGGMRQAGHLAAAGIVALEQQVDRLREDHEQARSLARGMAGIRGLEIDPGRVRTNILFFRLNHPQVAPESFLRGLEERGIRLLLIESGLFRAVTNRHVTAADVERVLSAMREILGQGPGSIDSPAAQS